MDNFWEELKEFDLEEVRSPSSGLDHFFEEKSVESTTTVGSKLASKTTGEGIPNRLKVSSPSELEGFQKISNSDKLIRMSEKDLWAIEENEEEGWVIERLFDEDGEPLKV